MLGNELLLSKEYESCVDFHGHSCPGLLIGFRASKAGLEWLQANRSMDEEIVAIVETDACSTDAVQMLTGCTSGKGNLLIKNNGKMGFTFLSRQSGKGVRIAIKADVFDSSDRDKIFQRLLNEPFEDLFTIESVEKQMPEKAVVEDSMVCDLCNEPTMASKLEKINDQYLCRECQKKI